VEDTFWPVDAVIILNFPTNENVADWPAWHFDSKGIFSVRSAYKLVVQLQDEDLERNCSTYVIEGGVLTFEWHKIWQLPYSNKVKMFIWRLAHNILPVKRNLARRGVRTDTIYPIYKRLDEDNCHLFFKCKWAKEFSRILEIDNIREVWIWELEKKRRDAIFIWMWHWWSAWNKANAGERVAPGTEIYKLVHYYLVEFEKLYKKSPSSALNRLKWRPPPAEYYKINVDASFYPDTVRKT
jgi:hypothetical protein